MLAQGDARAKKGDLGGALAAYRRALATDARSPEACRRLASLYAQLRLPAEGLEVSCRLLELQPSDRFAAVSKADMLESLGRVDEAYATLKPLIGPEERDPHAATVFARVCERLDPPRDEALPLMARLAADSSAAPRARVKALWSLVHTLDALGRYDEAFARALELKALEASAGIARPPQARERLDAAIAAYTPERFARLPRASNRSQLPLFVVGMLRSGTTLVEQILASHPEVHGAGELTEIASLAMRKLAAHGPYPACLDALSAAHLDQMAEEHLATLRKLAPKASRVVDKMPTNYDHLGLIELLFPASRIIHCRRDPLDNCLSLFYLPDTSNTESLEAVAGSYLRYERIMRHWRPLLRLPVFEMRYEELVADPERKVRELLEFCGLPWNDACLEFHRSGRYSRNFSYHQVRKPIYARSVGRHLHYAKHLAPLAKALARGAERPSAAAAPVTSAVAHFERARALGDKGDKAEAEVEYRRAIAADPRLAQAHNNLGNLLVGLGRFQEAAACLRTALEIKPDYPLALYNLGNALKPAGRSAEAIEAYERALALRPDYPECLNNYGNALKDLDRYDEAIAALRQAVALKPAFPEALHNLATALGELGRVDESNALFREALAAAPELADAQFGLSMGLLLKGEYAEGWKYYEARWRWGDFPGRKTQLAGPMWQGEPFPGKTLHLYFEQGMGDTLQCLRYVPLAAARGGKVVLEVNRAMRRLCAPLGRWAQVITGGERRPPYDLQCPMQSLPLAFGTTLDTIPADVPYLHAEPALVAKWRSRIGAGRGLKVGLVWAGNPLQKSEPKRGIGLERCLPLFGVPGVRWYSLMVSERAADIALAPPGAICDLSSELTDFAETAAVIANLDLVISTDTSVAHLAGALAAPTWVLLRHVPDWRWHLGRDDCPWYPAGMRLFRQPRIDDWDGVVGAVKAALAERAAALRPESTS